MTKTYVYPGTFSPPHRGHVQIALKFVEQYNVPLIVLCSENPDKSENWFTPDECKQMWLSYGLPESITVLTLAEFAGRAFAKDELVLVRGIRDEKDFQYEKKVLLYNKEKFNITQYLFIFGDNDISSSSIRERASWGDFHSLNTEVSLAVITNLWKYVLKCKSINMVVGAPGSGKTTILNAVGRIDHQCEIINTDMYNKVLRPRLEEHFGTTDLIEVAINRSSEYVSYIGHQWLSMLFADLMKAPEGKHILVEIAYGLDPEKRLYNYLGPNVIQINCDHAVIRNADRGTNYLEGFIDKINSWNSAASKLGLNIKIFESTNCSPETNAGGIVAYIKSFFG